MPPDPPTMGRTYKSYEAPGTRPPPQYFMKCPPLVATWHLQTCYNLFRQLAVNLRITNLLWIATLLTTCNRLFVKSCCKPRERTLILACCNKLLQDVNCNRVKHTSKNWFLIRFRASRIFGIAVGGLVTVDCMNLSPS